MLFENCRSGEERHRCTFYLVGRQQKHLTVALKKRACNFAENIAREGQSTVIEADVKGRPIEREIADLINPLFIQSDLLQLSIYVLNRTRESIGSVIHDFRLG